MPPTNNKPHEHESKGSEDSQDPCAPHQYRLLHAQSDLVPSIRIETAFADAMEEAAADGKLDAYFARPHVFYNNETVAPTDMSAVRAAVHNAWRAAAMARGPHATMVEAILQLADRALSKPSKQDDAALRSLYRKALVLLSDRPELDACPSPELDALGRLYPARRFLKWNDFENAVLKKLNVELGIGISPQGVAQMLSVWLLAAPVQRIVAAKKLRAAIEKKMSGTAWLDPKGNILAGRANLERMITAAMRAASVTTKMRWKTFKKD